jgi:hypothetical protein
VEVRVAGQVELAGRLEHVHERPWGSVWRASVRGGVVWVKVCAPVQAFEPRLTAALAGRWPGLLPEVLAADSERAWLLLGDAGERLGFGVGPEPWLSLLPAYAELQRGEVAHVAELLDAGVRKGAACILDWGDSCVSHPFLTLFVAFLHLEEIEGLAPGDPWFDRLRDSYLEPWGRPSELRQTFELAQRLGPFAHVFKELRVLDAIPETKRHFLAGLHGVLARCIASAA